MNSKQQRFVEEYVVDHNATQAAKRAGYSPRTAYSQGQRLLKHVEVQTAVAAEQARLRRKMEVTVLSLTEELEEARTLAIANGQASAAVQATMGISKLHGLLVDRSEVKTTSDMSLEQAQDRIKEIEAELAVLDGEEDGAAADETRH